MLALAVVSVTCLAWLFATADPSQAYYLGGSVFSIAVAVVILGLEDDGPSVVRRRLSSRPLVWIGTLSYGLYLWHWLFVVLFRRWDLHGPALGVAVAATAAAVLSARVAERPVREGVVRGMELTSRRTLVAATVAATPERLQPARTQAVAGDPTVVVSARRRSSSPTWRRPTASRPGPGGRRPVVPDPPTTSPRRHANRW